MVAHKSLGKKIVSMGILSVFASIIIILIVVVSIYGFTSYYDRQWQHSFASLSLIFFVFGLLSIPIGFLVDLYKNRLK